MTGTILIVAGALVIVFTLLEVFRDLFHPTASGTLSDLAARGTFNLLRSSPRLLDNAAPASIVLVIASWAALISVGFALIYWGCDPASFRLQDGAPSPGFWPLLYFSLEMMTTLGLGDIVPQSAPLRLLAACEALIGFGLLSASVSSVVLVHPALVRMRTLARHVSLVARASEAAGMPFGGETEGARVLASLGFEVARTQVDLVHFPILYYFHSAEEASLPRVLPHLLRLARSCLAPPNDAATRLAARILHLALQDLAATLSPRFVRSSQPDCDAVFAAYAQHHVTPAA